MVCGPGGPSSSSRTVLRKLLELEGDSQNSCSELLPTPLPQTQDGACLSSFWPCPSSIVINGPPRLGLL